MIPGGKRQGRDEDPFNVVRSSEQAEGVYDVAEFRLVRLELPGGAAAEERKHLSVLDGDGGQVAEVLGMEGAGGGGGAQTEGRGMKSGGECGEGVGWGPEQEGGGASMPPPASQGKPLLLPFLPLLASPSSLHQLTGESMSKS